MLTGKNRVKYQKHTNFPETGFPVATMSFGVYDLVHDSFERNNLIDDASKTALIKELRNQLVSWFEKYVNPSMDGTRFPVTGSGQKHRITHDIRGEDCFYTDRLMMDKNGVPKINPQYNN